MKYEGQNNMSNVQMHVYEYLGKENDPLYNNIMHLKANQSIQIPETKMQITKTRFGMYEIVSAERSSGQSLYEQINALLNAISLERL